MTFFKWLWLRIRGIRVSFSAIKDGGSAFARLALQEAQELDAKGKIIALDLAHKAKSAVVEEIKSEAARLHGQADKLKADLEEAMRLL